MTKIRQGVILLITPFIISAFANGAKKMDAPPDTTASTIAIVDLDQQIVQAGSEPGVEELLLVRSRYLGDYEALDRANRLSEGRFATAQDLLRRAHTRSAVHRFSDALADLATAEQMGADPKEQGEESWLRKHVLHATARSMESRSRSRSVANPLKCAATSARKN